MKKQNQRKMLGSSAFEVTLIHVVRALNIFKRGHGARVSTKSEEDWAGSERHPISDLNSLIIGICIFHIVCNFSTVI